MLDRAAATLIVGDRRPRHAQLNGVPVGLDAFGRELTLFNVSPHGTLVDIEEHRSLRYGQGG